MALSLTVSSQTPPSERWRLTPTDSLVHGPYSDLVRFWANRKTEIQIRREVAWRLVETGKLARATEAEVDVLREVLEKRNAEAMELRALLNEQRKAVTDCHKKNERLRSWATVGKVGTVAVGVGLAAGITLLIVK